MAASAEPWWIAVLGSTFGGRPDASDKKLWYEPLGFRPGDVVVPSHFWYGDQDELLGMGKEVQQRVPTATLTIYPGEGHMLNPAHDMEYLATLISDPS